MQKCKVDGVLCNGNAMCGSIGIGKISGYCTSSNPCEHKEESKEAEFNTKQEG